MKDGGPAFPESYKGNDAPHEGVGGGMSLLDWYAGMAMAAILGEWADAEPDVCAGRAYFYAEAMLAERETRGEPT